jgi:hypothetical protein
LRLREGLAALLLGLADVLADASRDRLGRVEHRADDEVVGAARIATVVTTLSSGLMNVPAPSKQFALSGAVNPIDRRRGVQGLRQVFE